MLKPGITTVSAATGRICTGRPPFCKEYRVKKRLFFLQGYPGTGKSTIIARCVDKLRKLHPALRVQGFYCPESNARLQKKHIAVRKHEADTFEIISFNGPKRVLASKYPISNALSRPLYYKKYKVDVAGFEEIALPEMELRDDTELFVVDEVGPMALMSKAFYPALLKILNSSVPVLGSLPAPLFSYMMEEVEAIRQRQDVLLQPVVTRMRKHYADPLISRINLFYLYRKEEGRDGLKRNHL